VRLLNGVAAEPCVAAEPRGRWGAAEPWAA